VAVKPLTSPRQHTGSRTADAMQRATDRVARALDDLPFARGVLRSVRFDTAGVKVVDHGLGTRAAFLVARQNYDGTGVPAIVVEADASEQAQIDLTRQLAVAADTECTVDLWFYPVASEAVPR